MLLNPFGGLNQGDIHFSAECVRRDGYLALKQVKKKMQKALPIAAWTCGIFTWLPGKTGGVSVF